MKMREKWENFEWKWGKNGKILNENEGKILVLTMGRRKKKLDETWTVKCKGQELLLFWDYVSMESHKEKHTPNQLHLTDWLKNCIFIDYWIVTNNNHKCPQLVDFFRTVVKDWPSFHCESTLYFCYCEEKTLWEKVLFLTADLQNFLNLSRIFNFQNFSS